MYALRLRNALPSLRARQRAGARAPRMPDLGSVCNRPIPSLRVRLSTPTGARHTPDAPPPEDRAKFAPPSGRSRHFASNGKVHFLSFSKLRIEKLFAVGGIYPLYSIAPPSGRIPPTFGWGAGKKRQSRPTWSCLWVSVETVGERWTTSKQISSGKKWLGRGQAVSPRQIYEASRVKNRHLYTCGNDYRVYATKLIYHYNE